MFEENLEDEDRREEQKYSWDEDYQRDILKCLLHDRVFLTQAIDLIKPNYFANKAHSLIAKILFDFFKKYRNLPTNNYLKQEIKVKVNNEKTLFYYLGELATTIQSYVPNLDSREYLLDKITTFAKIQALRLAYAKTGEILEQNPEDEDTWVKIYDILRNAMTVSKNFEIGLEYFKNMNERYERLEARNNPSENFILNFSSIDNNLRGGGLRRGQIGAFVAGSGVGKCHSYDTPVLMYDGTVKKVQDVRVGDIVMGDDSTPRKVLRLHRGIDYMYDIISTKGEVHSYTADHVLVLKQTQKTIDIKSRCKNVIYSCSKWNKDGIFEIPISEYLKCSSKFQNSMKLFRTGVNFKHKKVKIDPYVLGAWLGDGTSRNTNFTTQDFEIVRAFWKDANNRGLNVNEMIIKNAGRTNTYSVSKIGSPNSFLHDLRYYNVLNNKHVPYDYKVNSRKVRLEVLAGLIDTDGSKSNNCYDFINKNKTLAEDVVYLARSLGFAAYIKPCKKKSQHGTEGLYWRVTISGDCSQIPVRLEYKKCNKRKQIKDHLVTGFKVKSCGRKPYYGFETDGNHRYLQGDFTVVHNSVALTNAAVANVRRGKRLLYISLELDEDTVSERFDTIFTGEPIELLSARKNLVFEELEKVVEDFDDKNLIIIKDFPVGQADVNTFTAYIAQLSFYGFKPDMVIIDYVGEMKNHPNLKTYESRERSIRELRALAKEEDVCVLTAMQLNRGHKEAEDNVPIDERYLADSFGQTRPLDACWSIGVSKLENDLGIGRIYVIKHRDGKGKFQFYIEFNKMNLQINEISVESYNEKRTLYKEKNINDVVIDDIDSQMKKKKKKKRKEEDEDDDDTEE